MESVKKWDIFELTFCVENMSEPVQAGALKAAFHGEKETVEVESFYDGGNVYKVRFMPSYEGHYTYKVETGNYQLNKKSDKYEGEFEVIAAYVCEIPLSVKTAFILFSFILRCNFILQI